MQPSFLSRKVTFTIFNRKELQKNKLYDSLEKYSQMDAYDNDRAFFQQMSSAKVESSRGFFSRYKPCYLYSYLPASEDEVLKIGTMIRRPLMDVINDVRSICQGSSENGGVNLRQIGWTPEKSREFAKQTQAQTIEPEQEMKTIPIETRANRKSNNLAIKK